MIFCLEQELEGAQNLVLSVQDDAGVRTVMDELMEAAKHKNSGMRRVRQLQLYFDLIHINFIPTVASRRDEDFNIQYCLKCFLGSVISWKSYNTVDSLLVLFDIYTMHRVI